MVWSDAARTEWIGCGTFTRCPGHTKFFGRTGPRWRLDQVSKSKTITLSRQGTTMSRTRTCSGCGR